MWPAQSVSNTHYVCFIGMPHVIPPLFGGRLRLIYFECLPVDGETTLSLDGRALVLVRMKQPRES